MKKPRPRARGRKTKTSEDLARLAAEAAFDTKALEIVALKMTEIVNYTDFFVIASGRSARQAQAIADSVQRALLGSGAKLLGIEGEREGNWILIDAGDVIVHVFYQPVREFYELEKLYGDAPRLELAPAQP